MEGQEATYAFRDITKLKLNEKPEAPSMPGLQGKSSGSAAQKPRFDSPSFRTVIRSWLQFSLRARPKRLPTSPVVEPSRAAKAPTAEQLEQAKKFFAGFRIGMAVEVQGNSGEDQQSCTRKATKVTLLEMDFSELLSNDMSVAAGGCNQRSESGGGQRTAQGT